ncbi:MAG: hypothetical protein ACI9FB_002466 [Candidatus Azotimanducaceae bacterium]|jgi:hypothetical protein
MQESKNMFRFMGCYERPKLFNWITILLLTGWMVIVATVVVTTETADVLMLEKSFYQELLS